MQHLLKSFFHLLPRFFSEKNFLIFSSYVKLYLASFIHHHFKKTNAEQEKQIRFLGYQISFFSYPVLINLFEEIFIYRSYRFKSSGNSPLIFDCGSNIGISILYFKIFHPACRIMAFEPDLQNFRLLKRNVEVNKMNKVTLHNYALGERDGTCKLFNGRAGQGGLNSSIYSDESNANFSEVAMKKISGFIHEEIDFMKMDVEGAEGEIIQELSESGKLNSIKEMVLEFHSGETLSEMPLILALDKSGLKLNRKDQLYGKNQVKLLRFKQRV
jgi:FkbM family methyltransferase